MLRRALTDPKSDLVIKRHYQRSSRPTRQAFENSFRSAAVPVFYLFGVRPATREYASDGFRQTV
jgi:hypothetical protein